MIFHCAGLDPEVRATSEREYRTPARRPRYTALANTKLDALGIEPMPPLEKAVRSYLYLRASLLQPEG